MAAASSEGRVSFFARLAAQRRLQHQPDETPVPVRVDGGSHTSAGVNDGATTGSSLGVSADGAPCGEQHVMNEVSGSSGPLALPAATGIQEGPGYDDGTPGMADDGDSDAAAVPGPVVLDGPFASSTSPAAADDDGEDNLDLGAARLPRKAHRAEYGGSSCRGTVDPPSPSRMASFDHASRSNSSSSACHHGSTRAAESHPLSSSSVALPGPPVAESPLNKKKKLRRGRRGGKSKAVNDDEQRPTGSNNLSAPAAAELVAATPVTLTTVALYGTAFAVDTHGVSQVQVDRLAKRLKLKAPAILELSAFLRVASTVLRCPQDVVKVLGAVNVSEATTVFTSVPDFLHMKSYRTRLLSKPLERAGDVTPAARGTWFAAQQYILLPISIKTRQFSFKRDGRGKADSDHLRYLMLACTVRGHPVHMTREPAVSMEKAFVDLLRSRFDGTSPPDGFIGTTQLEGVHPSITACVKADLVSVMEKVMDPARQLRRFLCSFAFTRISVPLTVSKRETKALRTTPLNRHTAFLSALAVLYGLLLETSTA